MTERYTITVEPYLIPAGFKPVSYRSPEQGEWYLRPSGEVRQLDLQGHMNQMWPMLILEPVTEGAQNGGR